MDAKGKDSALYKAHAGSTDKASCTTHLLIRKMRIAMAETKSIPMLFAISAMLLLCPIYAQSQSDAIPITLAWDASTGASGYVIYYGTQSRNVQSYANSSDAGNNMRIVVSIPSRGYWCFAVTAYDSFHHESDFSNELCAYIYPNPRITNFTPNAKNAGSVAFTLHVEGSGIIPSSKVMWNGIELPTTYVDDSHLSALISGSLLTGPQAVAFTILNPTPGGGSSNSGSFVIDRALTSISVSDAAATFSPFASIVNLKSAVSSVLSDSGEVTLQVKDGDVDIGTPVAASNSISQVVTANYTLPAALLPKDYTIKATYSGGAKTLPSEGAALLALTQDPNQTVSINLPPANCKLVTTTGKGSTIAGYGRLNSSTSTSPVALANFAYYLNPPASASAGRSQSQSSESSASPILISEAGIPASPLMTAARMFVDSTNLTNSGIALVNPSNTSSAVIEADFRDVTGKIIAYTQRTLPAGQHISLFTNQLIDGLPNPALGTLTIRPQATMFSPPVAFSAINLSTAASGRNEFLMSALPVIDLNSPPTGSSLIFPQIADGGGWTTEIMLMNPSGSKESKGSIAFFDDDGKPLALDFGSGIGSRYTLDYDMKPDGMVQYSTSGLATARAGYAVVTVSSGATPGGAATFKLHASSGLVTQAGVMNAPLTKRARLYVERASSPSVRDTGIALVNPKSTDADLVLTLTGTDGSSFTKPIALPSKAHKAVFLSELFSSNSGVPNDFSGTLDIVGGVDFAAITLRQTINQRGDVIYSTLPLADLDNPPTHEQILPHFADGTNGDASFRTRFILINTGSAGGSAYLNLFDDKGDSINTKIFD